MRRGPRACVWKYISILAASMVQDSSTVNNDVGRNLRQSAVPVLQMLASIDSTQAMAACKSLVSSKIGKALMPAQ